MVFGSLSRARCDMVVRMLRRWVVGVAMVAATLTVVSGGARAGDAPATTAMAEPKGLAVGDAAPDAVFVTPKGDQVKAGELWGKGPVVVMFYRGGWCPFCTKSLAAWQGRLKELEDAGATLVAVTMEKPSLAEATVAKHAPGVRVLADADGSACRAFRTLFELDDKTREKYRGYGIDLEKRNENGKWELPVSATYVIDADGKVRWTHFDPDYTRRATPDEVISAVKGIRK